MHQVSVPWFAKSVVRVLTLVKAAAAERLLACQPDLLPDFGQLGSDPCCGWF